MGICRKSCASKQVLFIKENSCYLAISSQHLLFITEVLEQGFLASCSLSFVKSKPIYFIGTTDPKCQRIKFTLHRSAVLGYLKQNLLKQSVITEVSADHQLKGTSLKSIIYLLILKDNPQSVVAHTEQERDQTQFLNQLFSCTVIQTDISNTAYLVNKFHHSRKKSVGLNCLESI